MTATRASLLAPEADGGVRLGLWAAALALPVLGLVLLLAAPDADVQWEHHPSHFWLVLAAGATSAALAFSTSGVALRRSDARLYLVSLAFLSAAGFLGLHALSTPGVLLATPNQGFAVATPIGLLLSRLFAAASALPLGPDRARAVMRHAQLLRGVLLGAMAVWAAWSLLSVPPLDDPTPVERASGVLLAVPAVALVLYGFAVARYLAMAIHSGSPILVGVT
jgi:adenylate cyclase